jgi:hypothetical protein
MSLGEAREEGAESLLDLISSGSLSESAHVRRTIVSLCSADMLCAALLILTLPTGAVAPIVEKVVEWTLRPRIYFG